jgi:hypothetical protein
MKLWLAIPLLALALAACGSDDASPGGDDGDSRAATIACLGAQGIDAREQGDDEVVLTGENEGPTIRFYLTAGEAEAAQFEGDGEGAEQIGAALLFVRKADDDTLESVEDCLTSI